MTYKRDTHHIPHLGGSEIAYYYGNEPDPSRPTLVLVNSFTTSVELYKPQFDDSRLAEAVNLLAIEPFGHGLTRAGYRQFTYWDTAVANLQLLEALNISEVFVLGTSQGGWISAMMAMLDPQTVQGIIPLGTSMDAETQRSRDLGCWDGVEFCTPAIEGLAGEVGDDWVVPGDFVDGVLEAGLGDSVSPDVRAFWHEEYQRNYRGDEGRHRLRVATINLRDRDGLHARLDSVKCPVLRMHGTADTVYSVANAEEETDLFVNSHHVDLRIVEGGHHFLSYSNPSDVNTATLDFIEQWK